MKHFIITGLAFFIFALVATVVVFFLARTYLPGEVGQIRDAATDRLEESMGAITGNSVREPATSTVSVGDAGIPLRTLSLEGAQKKVVEAVGIDVETFIITQPMLVCARNAVGDDRVAAFVAGEAPSVIEMAKLVPCLQAS